VTIRIRPPAALTAATLALALQAGLPGTVDGAPTVNQPRSGKYTGFARAHRKITLLISGRSIQIVAFQFKCGTVIGTTSLDDIRTRKTSTGYRFGIRAHGSITFSDNQTDENGAVDVAGRFSFNAQAVRGTLRVRSPRCHDTGTVHWSARRH
jgi:hypothetical protein